MSPNIGPNGPTYNSSTQIGPKLNPSQVVNLLNTPKELEALAVGIGQWPMASSPKDLPDFKAKPFNANIYCHVLKFNGTCRAKARPFLNFVSFCERKFLIKAKARKINVEEKGSKISLSCIPTIY